MISKTDNQPDSTDLVSNSDIGVSTPIFRIWAWSAMHCFFGDKSLFIAIAFYNYRNQTLLKFQKIWPKALGAIRVFVKSWKQKGVAHCVRCDFWNLMKFSESLYNCMFLILTKYGVSTPILKIWVWPATPSFLTKIRNLWPWHKTFMKNRHCQNFVTFGPKL